jgi:predicted ferric reductase
VQILHLALYSNRHLARSASRSLCLDCISYFGPALAIMHCKGSIQMLWTIFVILLVLWALGMATSYTAGGLIHILLVVAVIVLVFRLIQGRRMLG